MSDRSTGSVAMNETDRLIASDKVEGTSVYNRQGEGMGSIYTLMIDKRSGQVEYAVMSFGGFLGIGERYHPLPWTVLTYDTRLGGFVVDLSREQLERAPSYARDETPWRSPATAAASTTTTACPIPGASDRAQAARSAASAARTSSTPSAPSGRWRSTATARPRGAQSAGSLSPPKRASVGQPAAATRCVGPVSFPTA